MEIDVGDPVILKDATKLKKYGLYKGMKGMCNSISVIPEDGEYIHFMPEGVMKIFVIKSERLILDEERLQIMKEGSEE